ncbi:hypothetical protein [Escherichia fergusonii]|uniref:hypothetical protein n=1 Tax=Escherichia fergusonii TaxID=564 RepID=UPI001CBB715E|nr:hypothetical protein [Escherichia fergusonii]UAT38697.1 hypothetical protein KYC43_15605 [Escherichia fergusonii]HAW1366252.1 hypothetical protein [Escherichia coli]HCJ9228004.1 hypothetical protein [Escherichia coli]
MLEKLLDAIRNSTESASDNSMRIERIIVSTEDQQHYYSINPYKDTVVKVADQYGKPIEGEVEIPLIPPLFYTN